MLVSIHSSRACENELRYICELIFTDILGLSYEIHYTDASSTELVLGGKKISLPNIFFSRAEYAWLSGPSLPEEPLPRLEVSDSELSRRLCHADLPVLYGSPCLDVSDDQAGIGIDILGSCFYLASLYGEAAMQERDPRGRVPYSKTLACRENLISRPLGNEYLELLWYVMQRLHPGLQRKERAYTVCATQDVDIPYFKTNAHIGSLARACVGDLVRRGSPGLAARRLQSYVTPGPAGLARDPNNTFAFFMNTLEDRSLQGEFNFIPGATPAARRIHGDIQSPEHLDLMKSILDRGHRVGLHPFYNTYKDPEALRLEKEYLDEAIKKIAPSFRITGGRQHGLQWEPGITWALWNQFGLAYDSSVGFAEMPGFRSGFCLAYRAYDLQRRIPLDLVERPLICMDTTYTSYLKMSDREYVSDVIKRAATCRKFGGDFVGLWHNSKLAGFRSRQSFTQIMDTITAG